jgi:type IX secretion system PorP/SprF family membrane protein
MKHILPSLIACLIVSSSLAQDPHFSQYSSTPLILNPANTGLQNDLRAIINYKNQWSSVADPYKTSAFSFDMRTSKGGSDNSYLGLGAQVLHDKAGGTNMALTQAAINVSGIIKIDAYNKLSTGIMGGFGQRRADYSELRWESQYSNGAYNDQLSSNEVFESNSFTYFDAGAGIAWTYGKDQAYITANNGVKATVGFSASHFGLPNASFVANTGEKLKTKFIGHASMELGKENTNLTIMPSIYYVQQGSLREILVGSSFRYLLQEGSHFTGFNKSASITIGAHYRVLDALITSFQIDFSNYTVGVSYDVNISQLSSASQMRGGIELFLRFVTPNPFAGSSSAKFR